MNVSKFHVTLALGLIAIVSMVCGTVVLCVAISHPVDIEKALLLTAPFLGVTATAVAAIAGVAVPSFATPQS